MDGVQRRIDLWDETRETVIVRHSHMQMRVQRALPVVGHQDFHLANRQVLDVLVLRSCVLDIGFASGAGGLVSFLEKPSALNSQCPSLLPYPRRCFEEVLGCLLV